MSTQQAVAALSSRVNQENNHSNLKLLTHVHYNRTRKILRPKVNDVPDNILEI